MMSESKPLFFSLANAMGLQTFFFGDQFVILSDWTPCYSDAQIIRTQAKSPAKTNYRRLTKINNRSFRYKIVSMQVVSIQVNSFEV